MIWTKNGGVLHGGTEPGAFAAIKHDQVDVARIVKLMRAVFAHREDDEAGALLGVFGIGSLQFPALHGPAQEEAHGGADEKVGGFA